MNQEVLEDLNKLVVTHSIEHFIYQLFEIKVVTMSHFKPKIFIDKQFREEPCLCNAWFYISSADPWHSFTTSINSHFASIP